MHGEERRRQRASLHLQRGNEGQLHRHRAAAKPSDIIYECYPLLPFHRFLSLYENPHHPPMNFCSKLSTDSGLPNRYP